MEKPKPESMLSGVVGRQLAFLKVRRKALESAAKESKSLVDENGKERAGTRVPQDTRNPAGSRRDHPPRLNTT